MAKNLKLQVMLDAVDKMTAPLKRIDKQLNRNSKAFAENKKKLAILKKSQSDLSSFRNLHKSTRELGGGLKEASKKVNELKKQLAKTSQPTKKLTDKFSQAKKAAAKLKAEFNSQRSATEKIRRALASTGISTKNLAQGNRKLATSIGSVNAKLDKQKSKLAKLNKKQRQTAKLNRRMGKLKQAGTGAGVRGAAGVAVGAVVAKSAASFFTPVLGFTKELSAVQAKLGIKKKSSEMKAIREQAKTLGANTSFTATEVAGGQNFLAQAGFNAKAIQNAMPSMVDLAKAGDLDLPATADIASNIMGAFKIPASETKRVADILAATSVSSNVNLSMLGETMKGVAPIAAKAGAGLQDVAAMTGLLGNIGIQGSQADTALKNMYTRMAAPPKDAEKALIKLKISTKDAKNNLRPMTDILADIHEKTKNLGTAKQLGYFKSIMGLRATAGGAEMVSMAGSGELQKYIDKLKNVKGKAEEIRKVMEDNADGDIEKAKSAWQGLAIAMSEGNNSFRKAVQHITKLINKVTDWVKKNPKLTATILKVVAGIAALAAAGGAISLVFSGLTSPIIGAIKAFSAIKTVITGVARAGMFLMANPIFLAIGLLAGAAYLIYKNWDAIVVFFKNMWAKAKNLFAKFWNWVKPIVMWSPIGVIIRNWDAIKNFFGKLWDGVKLVFSLAWDGIKTLFDWSPLSKLGLSWSGVGNFFGALWRGVKAVILAPWNAIKALFDWSPMSKMGLSWGGVASFFSGLWRGVKAVILAPWNAIKALFDWSPMSKLKTAWGGVKGFFGGIWDSVKSYATTKLTEIAGIITGKYESFKTAGKNLIDGVTSGLGKGWGKVKSKVSSLANSISGWFKSKLGIHSPSRVFAQLGRHTVDGLAVGLSEQQKPVSQVKILAEKIKKQGKLITFTAGMGLAGQAVANTTGQNQQIQQQASIINITVNAVAGMNEQDLAQQIAQQVSLAISQSTTSNNALFDED